MESNLSIERLKYHLINLLYEDFKHQFIFKKYEELGISFSQLNEIKISDIVLDIIGFPRDNTTKYDFMYLNSGGEMREKGKIIPDDNMFCRDYLDNKLYDIIYDKKYDDIISLSESKLLMKDGTEEEIKSRISLYVNWLYEQHEEYIKERFDV